MMLNEEALDGIKNTLTEITNDLCDPNVKISYYCAKIIKIIIY